jgi:hypothetical protein
MRHHPCPSAWGARKSSGQEEYGVPCGKQTAFRPVAGSIMYYYLPGHVIIILVKTAGRFFIDGACLCLLESNYLSTVLYPCRLLVRPKMYEAVLGRVQLIWLGEKKLTAHYRCRLWARV